MRPMSLYESLDSTGEVSLKVLFETPDQIEGENSLDLNQVAFLVCRGGWPRATGLEGEVALEQAFDYYDAVVKSDISRADGVIRNPERVKRLMRSYARNQGSQATNTLLKFDGSDWGWRLRVQKAGWSICSSDRLPEGLIE